MKQVNLVILASLIALAACAAGCEEKRPEGAVWSPISALRTLSSAQELYKTRTGMYGDYCDLNDWKHKKYIYFRLAMADPDHPQHEDYNGFNIDISVNADNTDWCAISTPGFWNESGDMWQLYGRNLKITSDGIIRYNQNEGNTSSFPWVLGED